VADAASLSPSRIFLARRHHPRKTRLGVQAAITPSKNHCAAAIINHPYQMISKLKLVDFPLVADGSLCKIAHIHAPSMPIIAGYFALQAGDARQSYIFPMPLLPHGARMDAKGYLRLRRHASTTPESVAAHEVRCPPRAVLVRLARKKPLQLFGVRQFLAGKQAMIEPLEQEGDMPTHFKIGICFAVNPRDRSPAPGAELPPPAMACPTVPRATRRLHAEALAATACRSARRCPSWADLSPSRAPER
jgi:hypothetical protein